MARHLVRLSLFAGLALAAATAPGDDKPVEISGRYPHLAMWNRQGECGVGAVVPWAGRLWVVTYAPHAPTGSDDKLYEIDEHLNRVVRPESVGGTPANRMIHRESNQLNIGPYFIDARRNVRVVPPSKMFGRLTATARHLTAPADKLYLYDMEGLLYEVDVHSLEVKLLFKRPAPGWHGKGCYSGQGRLVLANNGSHAAASVERFKPFDYFIRPEPTGPDDAGILAEWDGADWHTVLRRQFTDVTGPGGIFGPPDENAPLWAIGWDRRSVLLQLCDAHRWQTFRLPIADYSYVNTLGWYTEWPRIREVIGGKYLMNMHGGWFDFPATFSSGNTGGLRPLGNYLKITGDFCAWKGRIVFGCDDTAKSGMTAAKLGETLNRLNGRSNSNLWFTTWDKLSKAGPPAGVGGPWVHDDVEADVPSDPFLIAGYPRRVLHLAHRSEQPVTFTIELDQNGDGRWSPYRTITVEPNGYRFHIFPGEVEAQWARLRTERDANGVLAFYHASSPHEATPNRQCFKALADVDQPGPWTAAVMRSEGDDRVALGVLAWPIGADGAVGAARTYQCDPDMQWTATAPESASARFLREQCPVKKRIIEIDDASVVVTEGALRVRLPKSAGYDAPWPTGWPRALREVVTERSLLNAAGSFYVLPRDNAGGLQRIKPVCTHNKRITDFCSWRGLLVLAGCVASAEPDGHYFATSDRAAGLWFGDIDDLWKLGEPVGRGGPWRDTAVEADELSDPYLMYGYDRKTLVLSHDAPVDVTFTVLVDVTADDAWLPYATIRVPPGQSVSHAFPEGYSAHWVRLQVDRPCKATATFNYR